jgi:riboflavin transporter FmnP
MGSSINANIKNLTTFVLLSVAPLNLIKGTLVSYLTLLLYKRVEKLLFNR